MVPTGDMRSVAFAASVVLLHTGLTARARADGPFASDTPALRAEARKGTKVSLTGDGPWLGAIDTEYSNTLAVYEDAGPRLQFGTTVFNAGGEIELAMYADRATLYRVTTSEVPITPTPGIAGPRAAWFRPDAGVVLDEIGRRGDMVEVRLVGGWQGGKLEVRGFVPANQIGTVFHPTPERDEGSDPTHEVRGRIELHASPGGPAFATFESKRSDVTVLARQGKHAQVRIHSRLIGWLPAAKLKHRRAPRATTGEADGEEGGVEGGVAGGCCYDGQENPRYAVLLSRTRVHDAPDGSVIGIVRQDWIAERPERKGEWVRLELTTRYGKVSGWAKPATAEEIEARKPPPPPPPPRPPQLVAPGLLEAVRIAGTKDIAPDAATQAEIAKSGKSKIMGSYKICVDTQGKPLRITLMKSTGFPAYDARIAAEMKRWRYRPFLVNGTATPVCTAVTFIYSSR